MPDDVQSRFMEQGEVPWLPELQELAIQVEAGWKCAPEDDNDNNNHNDNERCRNINATASTTCENRECKRARNSRAILHNRFYLPFGTKESLKSQQEFEEEINSRFFQSWEDKENKWIAHLNETVGTDKIRPLKKYHHQFKIPKPEHATNLVPAGWVYDGCLRMRHYYLKKCPWPTGPRQFPCSGTRDKSKAIYNENHVKIGSRATIDPLSQMTQKEWEKHKETVLLDIVQRIVCYREWNCM